MPPAADFSRRSAASYRYFVRVSGVIFAVSLPAASRSRPWRISPRAPRRISLPSPHSARYTRIPGGCRRGPSVPSPGPEHRTGTGSFPVLVRERGQPPVSVVLIRRSATRRIRLPAHPPRRPAASVLSALPGWCISPAVPPHPAGNAPYARPRT